MENASSLSNQEPLGSLPKLPRSLTIDFTRPVNADAASTSADELGPSWDTFGDSEAGKRAMSTSFLVVLVADEVKRLLEPYQVPLRQSLTVRELCTSWPLIHDWGDEAWFHDLIPYLCTKQRGTTNGDQMHTRRQNIEIFAERLEWGFTVVRFTFRQFSGISTEDLRFEGIRTFLPHRRRRLVQLFLL